MKLSWLYWNFVYQGCKNYKESHFVITRICYISVLYNKVHLQQTYSTGPVKVWYNKVSPGLHLSVTNGSLKNHKLAVSTPPRYQKSLFFSTLNVAPANRHSRRNQGTGKSDSWLQEWVAPCIKTGFSVTSQYSHPDLLLSLVPLFVLLCLSVTLGVRL